MELEEAALSTNLTSSLWLLGNSTDDGNDLMVNCSLVQNGTEAFEHCQESAGKFWPLTASKTASEVTKVSLTQPNLA